MKTLQPKQLLLSNQLQASVQLPSEINQNTPESGWCWNDASCKLNMLKHRNLGMAITTSLSPNASKPESMPIKSWSMVFQTNPWFTPFVSGAYARIEVRLFFRKLKVRGPYSAIHINWTPIFEWCVIYKWIPNKTCLKEIGPCVQNL